MPSLPHIVVIAIDRLGSPWLGPYGNAWIETPALNHLAAQSTLCEFMLSDSHDLGAVYRSYFTGLPAWRRSETAEPTLPQLARAANYETLFVTDAAEVAHHPLAGGFERVDLLAWQQPACTARETSQTRLAEVFSAASEALLASGDAPRFLWIHAAAMDAAWDAPHELRERMAAEDDPEPPHFVVPPSLELAHGHDPDELLGIVQAYAAEVMAFDDCLASFLTALDQTCDPANTLLLFTSPRGYPLGEHLRIGPSGDALRGELLQVPLLIRFPRQDGRLTRLAGLHQPSDLFALIRQAIGSDINASLEGLAHEYLVADADNELSLRTAHWFYRERDAGEDRSAELYSKPDDRWEVNEVSQRATEVVAGFAQLADWVRANRDLPGPLNLPELPEELAAARR